MSKGLFSIAGSGPFSGNNGVLLFVYQAKKSRRMIRQQLQ